MTYRRRASPLHAARAGAGAAWCAALAGCALAFEHPLVLAAVGAAAAGAALGAGVARPVARACLFTLPIALLLALINPFVSRDGLTVLVRLGEVPPLGQVDLTLEALAYGLVSGARLLLVVACFALLAAAVDPDGLLRLFRRVSFRSALAAALAVRLVPVLARDARRLAEAQRCRPAAAGGGRGRAGRDLAVLRAVTSSALDRAVDVAATLEVRGYAGPAAGRAPSGPWSRHDLAFAASALAVAVLAAAGRVGGWAPFAPYPVLDAPVTAATWALAGALVLVALLPFADRRGIAP